MRKLGKTILLIPILLLLVSPIGCTSDGYWCLNEPLGRINYSEIDLEEANSIRKVWDQEAMDFWDRMGLPNYFEDIKKSDPIDVGLYFAGYPNIDGLSPDKVTVFYTSGIEITMIVLDLNLMDDSILDHEERIDLRLDNGEWIVVWAGYRQRCRRSIDRSWRANLCP